MVIEAACSRGGTRINKRNKRRKREKRTGYVGKEQSTHIAISYHVTICTQRPIFFFPFQLAPVEPKSKAPYSSRQHTWIRKRTRTQTWTRNVTRTGSSEGKLAPRFTFLASFSSSTTRNLFSIAFDPCSILIRDICRSRAKVSSRSSNTASC